MWFWAAYVQFWSTDSKMYLLNTFSEMKFKDFSMTFQRQNDIFQAPSNRYRSLFCDEKTGHTPNCNIHCFQLYSTSLLQYRVYNPNCTLENMDRQINNNGDLMTWIARSIVMEIWWQNYRIPLFFSNQMCKMHNNTQIRFVEPLFFKPIKVIFKHFSREIDNFLRQIEKSNTFEDII